MFITADLTDRRRLVVAAIFLQAERDESAVIDGAAIRTAIRAQATDRCPEGTCTSRACCDYRRLSRVTARHLRTVLGAR